MYTEGKKNIYDNFQKVLTLMTHDDLHVGDRIDQSSPHRQRQAGRPDRWTPYCSLPDSWIFSVMAYIHRGHNCPREVSMQLINVSRLIRFRSQGQLHSNDQAAQIFSNSLTLNSPQNRSALLAKLNLTYLHILDEGAKIVQHLSFPKKELLTVCALSGQMEVWICLSAALS
jgi:hypothetical protein